MNLTLRRGMWRLDALLFQCLFASAWSTVSAHFLIRCLQIVFLVSYARAHGIDEVAAASLIGIIGGASIAGRLGFGALGDKISRMRLFQSTFIIVALSYLVWLFSSHSFTLLMVFAVLLGGGYGGFIVLSPAVAAEIFGLVGLGTILGATYTAAGIGGAS